MRGTSAASIASRGLTALAVLSAGILIAGGRAGTARAGESPLQQGPRRLQPNEHGVGRMVPDFPFTDVNGRKHRLGDMRRGRALVIALTSTTCPLSRRYAPVLARLEKRYAARGAAFLFVNPVASEDPAAMKAAAREHGFSGPYVHDGEGRLARTLGALTTTDVFLVDSARTLVYRGAVDDRYGLGYALDAPRNEYLAGALDALMEGRAPAIAATWAPGCDLDLARAPLAAPAPTYHNRISRIVQLHCVECHRKDGAAPFSLESYAQVAARAGVIRASVERGAMPPWFAAPPAPGEKSPWANDRSLPAADRADLLAWLGGSRPEGDPADAPRPRAFPAGWQIGAPDAVVQIPRPIQVAAEGTMPYQNVEVPTDFGEDRWVQAVEVQPTAREVVHHVLVFAIPKPQPGEKPLERLRRAVEGRLGFFAAYVPGNSSLVFPEGFAKPLPAGATLHFQIHYTPNGTAARDQTRLGLVFAKQPPKHVVRVTGIANVRLAIPPGAADHADTARIPMPADVKLLAFFPHMHVRGKAFRYDLILPGGERKRLLDVPRYDFNWQLEYRLAEPVDAPRGSRIEVTGWFDNSAGNPANPDPTKTVRWGPQTTDEMLLGYVEFYVPSEAPAAAAAP